MKASSFFVLLFAVSTAYCQSVFEIYNSAGSGLPFNWVNDMEVADDGTVWFATELGLAAFDGSSWSVWSESDSDLPDNVTRSLTLDPDGSSIWIGSFMGGLTHFDGADFTTWNSSNSDLPENFVRDMEFAPDGTLWIGTTAGIAVFDGTDFEVWNTSNSDLMGNNTPSIHVDADATIWAGSINAGLSRFNGKGFDNWNISNSDLIDNTILDIASDSEGNLWLATPAGGIGLMQPSTGDFAHFLTSNSDLPDQEVFRVEIDAEDRLVAGLASAGLVRYDGSSWEIWNTANSNIPDDILRGLLLEGDSALWVGTELGGAARLRTPPSVSGFWTALRRPLSVFPNPSQGLVQFESGTCQGASELKINDLSGREVFSTLLTLSPQERHTIPVKLSTGAYLVSLRCSKMNFRAKFVVE